MLDDYTTAPIDEPLRATLALLKKMTLDHAHLEPEDIRAVMRTGVSKQAIREALEVAFLFPWAVAFGKLGATGFWSMIVFLAVLTVGFAYEWKKGALEWE